MKDLLLHVDGAERFPHRLELAVNLARRLEARLVGLFAEVGYVGRSLVARRSPDDVARSVQGARALFDARTAAGTVATEWWQLDAGAYAELVSAAQICCRYVDLPIFGQPDAEDRSVPADLVEQVLLHGGRPVLVVPFAGQYRDVGRRVLVAWNSSREAARALNDAIPLMRNAETVVVVAFQRAAGAKAVPLPHLDVVAHLARHGINAQYERRDESEFAKDEEIGVVDALLNRGFELQADLTVIGGCRQYGLPFLHRGSSARQVLRAMATPVLLSY